MLTGICTSPKAIAPFHRALSLADKSFEASFPRAPAEVVERRLDAPTFEPRECDFPMREEFSFIADPHAVRMPGLNPLQLLVRHEFSMRPERTLALVRSRMGSPGLRCAAVLALLAAACGSGSNPVGAGTTGDSTSAGRAPDSGATSGSYAGTSGSSRATGASSGSASTGSASTGSASTGSASAGFATAGFSSTGASGSTSGTGTTASPPLLSMTNTFSANRTTISTSEGAPYADCDFWTYGADCTTQSNFGYGPTKVMRLYVCLSGEVSVGSCSQQPAVTGPLSQGMLNDIDTRLAAFAGSGVRLL